MLNTLELCIYCFVKQFSMKFVVCTRVKYLVFMIEYKWVLVNLIGKVFYRHIKDLGSNSAYTKNQFLSWHDNKEQLSWSRCHRFKSYHIYKKNKIIIEYGPGFKLHLHQKPIFVLA